MKRVLLPALVLGVCCVLFSAQARAQTAPPRAPVHEVVDRYFGQEVRDPYRYMEESTPEATDWIRQQGDYTERVLGSMPEREKLRKRLHEIDDQIGLKYQWITRLPGERYLYSRSAPGEDVFKLYLREGLRGTERLLVDPEKYRKAGDDAASLEAVYVCPYNDLVAYAISIGRSERATLRVMDMGTGKDVDGPAEDVLRFGSIYWSADGRSFFYQKMPKLAKDAPQSERYLNSEVRRHVIGEDWSKDRLMIGPNAEASLRSAPTEWSSIYMPVGSKWAVAVVNDGVRAERTLYTATKTAVENGHPHWRKIVDLSDDITEFAVHGDDLYAITHKQVLRGKIVRIRLGTNAPAEEVYYEAKTAPVTLSAGRDSIYATVREGFRGRLLRIPYGRGKAQEIALPEDGIPEVYSTDTRLDGALFTVHGWTSAEEIFSYDAGVVRNTLMRPRSAAEKGVQLEVSHADVASHDGVRVPLTIIHRKGLKRGGDNLVYLTGYGSYGASMEPFFNAFALAWYELGGTVAVAHVRGGGEFGEEWHEAGSKAKKQNTWKDFIACAEYLVREHYTRPERLAIGAVSAGGILAGRALTERPDLFRVVWIGAGVTDTVREEFQRNGPVNIPEFGTVKKEEEFRWLLEMSAYHHVREGAKYPAVLLTTGLHDPVVDPWQPGKMAASLQAATTSGRPVLLRVDNAGHDEWGATRSELYALRADQLTFMLWQLRDDNAPPIP